VAYFGNIWDGIRTTAQGLKLTTGVFFKTIRREYTVEYPDEVMPIDGVTHRGIHEFDVDRCIACFQCSNACPVDCIYIESATDAKGKPSKGENAVMTRYDIDYGKCLFCSLCVPPCPTECVQLGERYSLPGHTRDDMVVHFHQGGYPIRNKTKKALENVEDLKSKGLFEKKKAEREALGIPTLQPQY
jgi:NADH-quinone oxidoreductase subunit I